MDPAAAVHHLLAEESRLAGRWTPRFHGPSLPTVAAELLHATIRSLDGGSAADLTEPALALGVLRAQQGHTATSLVEDVLSLRPVLWGEIARIDDGTDLGLLVVLQDQLTETLDLAVREAVAAYVDESTRVLAAAATRDVLTGIGNRARFLDVLGREVAGADRNGAPALVMMDLDGFKQVNDTLGHLAGDEVLARVAAVLKDACRPSDVPCRLGGDEFTIVLPRTTLRQAMVIAQRCLDGIRADEHLAGLSAQVGSSAGVAQVDRPRDVDHLVAMADAALYRSKAAGGHRVEVGTDDDDPGPA